MFTWNKLAPKRNQNSGECFKDKQPECVSDSEKIVKLCPR